MATKKDLPAKHGELLPELPKPDELAKLNTDEKLIAAVRGAMDAAHRAFAERAAIAGAFLHEAKRRVEERGESWKVWLEANEFPKETARRWMELADAWSQVLKNSDPRVGLPRVSITFALECHRADREAERKRGPKAKVEQLDPKPEAPKREEPVDAAFEVKKPALEATKFSAPNLPPGLVNADRRRTPEEAAQLYEQITDLEVHIHELQEALLDRDDEGEVVRRDRTSPPWAKGLELLAQKIDEASRISHDMKRLFGDLAVGQAQVPDWFREGA